jgi:hypothetical protein
MDSTAADERRNCELGSTSIDVDRLLYAVETLVRRR